MVKLNPLFKRRAINIPFKILSPYEVKENIDFLIKIYVFFNTIIWPLTKSGKRFSYT